MAHGSVGMQLRILRMRVLHLYLFACLALAIQLEGSRILRSQPRTNAMLLLATLYCQLHLAHLASSISPCIVFAIFEVQMTGMLEQLTRVHVRVTASAAVPSTATSLVLGGLGAGCR